MNVFKLIEEHGLTLHGDIEHFAELVRADEREACAQACEDLIGTRAMAKHCADAIRARGEWVKTYCGGKPNYTTPEEREWVGLTDHELQVLDFNDPDRGKLARAVEAKLKERNQ